MRPSSSSGSCLHEKLVLAEKIEYFHGELIKALPISRNYLENTSSSFERYPLQIRHKQDWGRGFILLLPQTAELPESVAGSGIIKPASSFVI